MIGQTNSVTQVLQGFRITNMNIGKYTVGNLKETVPSPFGVFGKILRFSARVNWATPPETPQNPDFEGLLLATSLYLSPKRISYCLPTNNNSLPVPSTWLRLMFMMNLRDGRFWNYGRCSEFPGFQQLFSNILE